MAKPISKKLARSRIRSCVYLIMSLAIAIPTYRYRTYGAPVWRIIGQPLTTLSRTKFVAHALGDIDGVFYTNSREAFEQSYREGYRAFEVDLELTRDGELVCFHLSSEEALGVAADPSTLSTEDFRNLRYLGRYQPLSAVDLLALLQGYPDWTLILDTKNEVSKIYPIFINLVRSRQPEWLERIVPQIYGNGVDDLELVMELYPAKRVVYSLYKESGSDKNESSITSRQISYQPL